MKNIFYTISNYIASLKNRRILLKFFAIFFMLIIVPVFISNLVIYNYSYEIIENEVSRSSKYIMNNIISYIDENISKLKEKAIMYTFSNDLSCLINEEIYMNTSPSLYTKVYKDLIKLKSSSTFFEGICIYLHDTEKILTDKGQYDSDYFITNQISSEKKDLGFWKNEFKTKRSYFKIISTKMSNSTNNMLLMITSLPLNTEIKASMILLVNESDIYDVIQEYGDSSTNYLVIDAYGNIVTSIGKLGAVDDEMLLEYKQKITSDTGIFRSQINGMRYTATYTVSEDTGLCIISFVPLNSISAQSAFIKKITIYVTIIILFAGLAIAVLISRREYKPIDTIVKYINGLIYDDSHKYGKNNEFLFIYYKLRNINSTNEDLKKSLNYSIPFLTENLLLKLLKGNYDSINVILADMNKFNIKFIYEEFCVISVVIDTCGENPDTSVNYKHKYKSLLYALLSNECSCYAVDTDLYKFCYILNNDVLNESKIELICRNYSEYLNNNNENDKNIRLTIGIGNKCNSITDLKVSFGNSLRLLERRKLKGNNETLSFRADISKKTNKITIEQNQITNALLSDDNNSVNSLINKVKGLIEYSSMTYDDAHYLLRQYTRTVISTLELKNINADNDTVFTELLSKIDILNNIDEFIFYIDKLFNNARKLLSEAKPDKKEELIECIKQIINNEYKEDLYLESVAYKLNLTPNYLSHVFKEFSGMCFSDYLATVRIERSKELLLNRQVPLQEICMKVGYCNVNTYIRAFKKVEGITPGRHREIYVK